jgi:hypothetical protein
MYHVYGRKQPPRGLLRQLPEDKTMHPKTGPVRFRAALPTFAAPAAP